jgi:hypothetical protein
VDSVVLERLHSLQSRLRKLRLEHEVIFRSVRNHAIAHRDHDARSQLKWTKALKPLDVSETSTDLLEWTASLLEFLSDCYSAWRRRDRSGV